MQLAKCHLRIRWFCVALPLLATLAIGVYWCWIPATDRLYTNELMYSELKKIAQHKNIQREDLVRLLGQPTREIDTGNHLLLFWKGNRRSTWDRVEAEYVLILPPPRLLERVGGQSYCIYSMGAGSRYTAGWKIIKKTIAEGLGLQGWFKIDNWSDWGGHEWVFPRH